jgi:hypothetical protein
MFMDLPDIASADKRLLKENINAILLQYVVKEQTMNIPAFIDESRSYREIFVIEIALKTVKKHKRISQLIHMLIPNPVILVMTCEKASTLMLAQKRKSLSDYSKITIENFLDTEWFYPGDLSESQRSFVDYLDVKNLSYANLYSFYSDLEKDILRYKLSQYTGRFTKDMFKIFDSHELREKITTLEAIGLSLGDLKKKIGKEPNFNGRMAINVEMGELKKKKKKLIKELTEDGRAN